MRFYYLTLTLLLAFKLSAQTSDAIELSSEQKALVQSQGATGISSIIQESGISFTSSRDLEDFISEVISAQLSGSSSIDDIAKLTTETVIVVLNADISENIDSNLAFEAFTSGISRGIIIAANDLNIDIAPAIEASSFSAIVAAVELITTDSSTETEISEAIGLRLLVQLQAPSKLLWMQVLMW